MHDMHRVTIEQRSVKHGGEFVNGVLDSVADAVTVPEAHKSCLRMDVGVLHRCVEKHFHWHCGKVYRVLDGKGMVLRPGHPFFPPWYGY